MDVFESAYLSTCSVCHQKYAGNGYNETKLPCPDCKKKQQAASIASSQWYLVRKDRNMQPWAHYVLMLSFKTATLADTYAALHQLPGYHPVHGYSIYQYQEDETDGLAQIIYLDAPHPKRNEIRKSTPLLPPAHQAHGHAGIRRSLFFRR